MHRRLETPPRRSAEKAAGRVAPPARGGDLRRRLADAEARAAACQQAADAARHELEVVREQSQQHLQQLLEAQVALEESHDRYVSLYDFAPVAFISLDQSGIVQDLNLSAAQLLGDERAKLVQAPLISFIAPESKRQFLDHLLRCRRGQVPAATEVFVRPRGGAASAADHAGDRAKVPALLSTWFGVPRHGAGWEFRTAVLDLTDRKRAEQRERAYQERLRSLASELSLAEERERRRIAVEIHDQISQTLAMAKMRLDSVGQKMERPEFKQAAKEVSEMVAEVLGHTRTLTFELSPPVLHELGFEPALEWLAERAQQRFGLSVKTDVHASTPPLPHDLGVLLFQAVRELLANVAKHARAKSATVRLRQAPGGVQVVVEDDGRGFAVDRSRVDLAQADGAAGGFGLFSIRARLEHLGGRLDVESPRGGGSRVTLTVPTDLPADVPPAPPASSVTRLTRRTTRRQG